jgi:DNA gyrase/topoisomerase IV subunit A
MCTKNGTVKKTKLEAYSRPRANGINAIEIREGDRLIEAKLTSGAAEIMIATREGKAIRFNEATVREVGRTSIGVRGVSLEGDNEAEIVALVEALGIRPAQLTTLDVSSIYKEIYGIDMLQIKNLKLGESYESMLEHHE